MKTWILIFLLLSLAITQDEGVDIENVQPEFDQTAEPELQNMGEAGMSEQMKQQFLSMRRTACLVLSRYHSNTQKQVIQAQIQSLSAENQQKYVDKIYSYAVLKCEPKISQQEVQQFFVANAEFDPSHLFHILDGVDYGDLVNHISSFTPEQQAVVKYIKNFDAEMAIKRQQQQAQQQDKQGNDQFEMKLFGLSFKSISTSVKMVYIGIFSVIVIAILYYGFSKLDQGKDKKKNSKRRKSPKKQ